MAGILCPNCQRDNPAGAAACKFCGAHMRSTPMVLPQQSSMTIGRRHLPSRELKALGASVAVSVVALLAEAGLIYLRRRVQQMELEPFTPKKEKRNLPAVSENPPPRKNKQVTTVLSERVVEEKRWGRKPKRIIERFAWRHEFNQE